jgi:hypothetical protein
VQLQAQERAEFVPAAYIDLVTHRIVKESGLKTWRSPGVPGSSWRVWDSYPSDVAA